jgi:pimeloyl-ACP methyl ester carboxylesterase
MKRPVEFPSKGHSIRGEFYLAEGQTATHTALFLLGFPNSLDHAQLFGLGQSMSRQGINTLTFAYRGTYKSEGAFSFENTLEDIEAAIAYLHQERVRREFQLATGKLVLGGISYGGGMALAYAANHPEIGRVFSIAGTDHGEFARGYERNPAFAEWVDEWIQELRAPAGPVRFDERKARAWLQNPDPYDLRLGATALADRDILLIGGWDDRSTTIEHHVLPFYRALVEAKAQSVQIAAVQDDHSFERSRDEIAETVIRWVKLS